MQLIDTQLKHNDCGVSVIKTICNIFGVRLSRSYIAQNVFLDAEGSRLSDIKVFFEQHGFDATPQLLDLNRKDENYYKAKVPFILPVETKGRAHYVVVNGYRKGRFEILDPAETAPCFLGLGELRKRVHVSNNILDGFAAKDHAHVVCRQLLQEYDMDMDAVYESVPVDHVFNKITYFVYIRDEFGFANTGAERNFLKDLLFNQDIAHLPQQFLQLFVSKDKAQGRVKDRARNEGRGRADDETEDEGRERVSIKAPVILPVRKNSRISTLNAPRKDEESRNAFLVLYDALGDHRKSVLLFLFAALFSVSFTQLYVFINQYFLDEILDLKNTSVIPFFILGMTIYYIFDLGLYLWKKWLSIMVSIRLDRLFLTSFDEKLNIYSLAFIQSFKKGDLTERLSDATKLKSFFTKYLVNILVDLAVSMYIMGVLLYLDWQLALVVLFVMGLFYCWFRCITPRLQRNEQVRFARKSDFFSTMLEKLEGIQTLKCLRYDRVFSRKITADVENLLDIQARTQKLNVLNRGVTSTITTAAKIMLVCFLAYASAADGALSIGEVVTFLTLSSRIFASLEGLLDENLTVQENAIILKRYLNFKESQTSEPQSRKPVEGMPFPAPIRSLALDAVCFGYHPADPILENLSITINRGDKIRIEGKNGTGKSTLSKVLALLYPAQSGTILVNGAPLESRFEEAVKGRILLVSNEDALFNDTVLYNLTFQNTEWDERIDVLAEKLGLSRWMEAMREQGAGFRISENGKNLSTGQRKKLLILRALLHPAEFVIFDEVLSGIDTASRLQIEEYLNTINDKTFIFISHESINCISFTKTFVLSDKRIIRQK